MLYDDNKRWSASIATNAFYQAFHMKWFSWYLLRRHRGILKSNSENNGARKWEISLNSVNPWIYITFLSHFTSSHVTFMFHLDGTMISCAIKRSLLLLFWSIPDGMPIYMVLISGQQQHQQLFIQDGASIHPQLRIYLQSKNTKTRTDVNSRA